MKCPYCQTDLGSKKSITAIHGTLLCNDCADKQYSEQELMDFSEWVSPADIGILPGISYEVHYVDATSVDPQDTVQVLHFDDITLAEMLPAIKLSVNSLMHRVTFIEVTKGDKVSVATDAIIRAVNKYIEEVK